MTVELIASGTAQTDSATFTVNAGDSTHVMLVGASGPAPADAAAQILLQSYNGLWVPITRLTSQKPSYKVEGPGVYRVRRLAGSEAVSVERSDAVPLAAPVVSVAPAITGTATTGNTLTCSQGTWTTRGATTYAYQWQKNGVNISGATTNQYVLVGGDAGGTITCEVTATNPAGSTMAESAGVVAA